MEDTAAKDSRSSSSVLGTAIGVLVFVVVVGVFLSTYDALAEGDGVLGVASENLQVETLQVAGGPMSLVARAPGGTMSIGLPISNRGFVPVTITQIEAVDGAVQDSVPPDADEPCEWRVTGVSTTREGTLVPSGGSFPSVRVAGRTNVQLYLGGTFPEGVCAGGGESSRDTLVVSYRVLGLIPRRQELPMLPITTTDADDPRFQ